jgi:pimeloyl-ACP methyl ester carboxylesterase
MLTAAFAAFSAADTIRAVHQHARTNVQHMRTSLLAKTMLYEDERNSRKLIADSRDALRWNDEASKLVAASKSPQYIEREKQRAVGLKIPHLPTLGSIACGLARGPVQSEWMTSDISHDPLLRDLLAVVRRQPEANLLLTWGEIDPLLPPSYTERITRMVGKLSVHSQGKIAVVIVPGGTHSLHSHYPQLVEAIPKNIFG